MKRTHECDKVERGGGGQKSLNLFDVIHDFLGGGVLVVSTSAFLVFFLAFSYRGVYFQWHSHCAPLVVLRHS